MSGWLPRMVCPVVLAVAVSGCAAQPDPLPGGGGSTTQAVMAGRQPIRPLMREHSSGLTEAARRVITDSADFRRVWDDAFRDRGPRPPLPQVDFSREVVVLAVLGTRNRGGYGIDIDSVRVSGGSHDIFVRTTSPGRTCGTTAAITEPAVMVAAPKASQPPRFHEENRVTDCG